MTGAFCLGEIADVLEGSDKPGYKGPVVDISLVCTPLQDAHRAAARAILQLPHRMLFQHVLRRWR